MHFSFRRINQLLFAMIVLLFTSCAWGAHTAGTSYITIEAGGAGGYGALNFERTLFSSGNISFTGRLGISTYHLKDFRNHFHPDCILPATLYASYGKSHKAEVGIGLTTSGIVKASGNEFSARRSWNIHPHLSFGYRYQPLESRFFIRLAYNPIFEKGQQFRHWAGIAIGMKI